MNKKELIKHIEDLPYNEGLIVDTIKISRNGLLKLIERLDEPQKVVVPQFVADWYEENKDGFEGKLYQFVYNLTSIFDGAKLNEFERWFLTTGTKPFQTLINMHQFGYEVEKEKRYVVKVKGNIKENMLVYGEFVKRYFFTKSSSVFNVRYSHTRKELEEADFGWVFDCPGIEIEEVGD